MPRLKRLIKHFRFEESNRGRITLGAGIRLDPETNRLKLSIPYTDDPAGATAYTWVTNPNTVKQWLGFEAVVHHAVEGGAAPGGAPTTVEITIARYRLNDGTDEYWWDGGAWVVNTTDWNTEAEVAANISSFPATSQQLGIVVNLATTNPAYTPELEAIKVLWATDVEFMEEYVYRMIVRDLKDRIRPITDYVISNPAGAGDLSTIDLVNDYPLQTPYNIVDVDAVYDHTADPKHQNDLLDNYNPTTKVITCAPIPEDRLVFVRLIYEPEVALQTSQDYSEISKVPAIALEDVDLVDASPIGVDDWIANKADGSAVKLPAPIQGDLEVTLHVLTDKGVDQFRLGEAVKHYFEQHPSIRSPGLDEEFSLWLIDEYDARTSPASADAHTGRLRYRVRDVTLYVRDSVDSFGVQRFLATGTEDFTLAE